MVSLQGEMQQTLDPSLSPQSPGMESKLSGQMRVVGSRLACDSGEDYLKKQPSVGLLPKLCDLVKCVKSLKQMFWGNGWLGLRKVPRGHKPH